jgi:hypothetical protein
MSEATTANVSQEIQTQNIPNVGGPRIPSAGPVEPPSRIGVPEAQVPAQESAKEAPAFDVEALAAALAKQNKTTEPEAKEETKDLPPTGNPAIDAGIAMLKKATGLSDADMLRAVGKAAEYGDENLIDTAYIKERFGEHADYAEMLAKAYLQDQVGQAQRAVQTAYDMVGGKDNWNSMATVFNAKAPEHLRQAARALADSGNIEGAAKLIVESAQSMGIVPKVSPKLQGGGAINDALDAKGFSEAYAALRKEAGNQSLESAKFKPRLDALMARRAAGKAKGF